MFCPKCATQNLDGASFCRSCGADISLVPQAMTGRLPEHQAGGQGQPGGKPGRHRAEKQPSLEKGITQTFLGIAFLLVAISIALFARDGGDWWFWMLIPSFALLGKGISEIILLRQWQKNTLHAGRPIASAAMPPASRAGALHSPNTDELVAPPPSVTEGTTRHLGAEAPTRHIGVPVERSERDV